MNHRRGECWQCFRHGLFTLKQAALPLYTVTEGGADMRRLNRRSIDRLLKAELGVIFNAFHICSNVSLETAF